MSCLCGNFNKYNFITESALSFTRTPDDPTYILKGQNATLVWEYRVDDKEKELLGIVWSVESRVTLKPISMLVEEKSGDRREASGIPPAYKGRVSIKEQATLVIENVTLNDSTAFSCTLRAEAGLGVSDPVESVQLIVTGMCIFVRKFFFFCSNNSGLLLTFEEGRESKEVAWIGFLKILDIYLTLI